MNDLVTIVVPVYNVEKYLEECVDSILKQTYTNIEVILVDDGSTDNSGIIADSYSKKYTNVKVVHKENGGLPSARNAGMDVAEGKYMMFVDSDDLIDERMVEVLLDRLLSTDSDMSICNYQVFNKVDRIDNRKNHKSVIDYSDSNSLMFFKAALGACWNRLFKTQTIKENSIRFESKSIVAQEDFYFHVKVFSFINRVSFVDEALYKYRERKTSITKKGQDETFSDRCLNFVHLAKDYIEKNSDKKCKEFCDYLFVNMFMASINNVTHNTYSEIKNVINKFSADDMFLDALRSDAAKTLYQGNSLQFKYYRTIVKMLGLKMKMLPAFLEHLRIVKLRSNTRREVYFD